MKARSYLILIALGLFIVAVAATGRWWLPPALEFAGSNQNAIGWLTSLFQVLLGLPRCGSPTLCDFSLGL